MKNGLLEIILLAQHKTDVQLALHAKRVACFAAELANILGHPDKYKKLFLGGLLHDLGFLSLGIHFSEGSLDLTQKQTIHAFRTHVTESERLAKSLTNDVEILQMIRHHHEKYNGEGYPDQLSGENIPLCARILAVADVYDSLLTGTLYGKKRMTPSDALAQILHNNNEFSLDPTIVEALIKLLDKTPVLLQPLENNALAVYKLIFLQTGILEQGDLINQAGAVILKQGQVLDEKTLSKIRLEFPGQKLIRIPPPPGDDETA